MQIEALTTFLTIDRLGGFHAAARHLNLTQTAVSARIRVLEQSLNSKLFERGPSGAQLTAEGRQFRPYAEQMLRTWEAASTGLADQLQERLSLRLGVQLSIWDSLLVDLAVWLEKERGKLPMTLNYDHSLDMAEAVQNGLLDFALVNQRPQDPSLVVVDLPAEELVLVTQPPANTAEDEPLFINLDLGHQYSAQWQGVIPHHTRQQMVMGGTQMGLRYLKKRGGMGYFPAHLVAPEIQGGTLTEIQDAARIRLDCLAIFRSGSELDGQIKEVLSGLRQLRDAPGP